MFRSSEEKFRGLVKRALEYFGLWRGQPPASPGDPYAWKPAPLKPRPHSRSGVVAVAEPDDPR
jgi:hypothetical protein